MAATPYSLDSGPTHRTVTTLALFAGLLALYLLTLQDTLYGDGVFYLNRVRDTLAGHINPVGHHPLYPPLLTGFIWLGGKMGLDLTTGGALFSALTGAAGVALVFPLLLDWTGGRKGVALFGTLLLGLSPVALFFSTTTENHTLHLLCTVVFLLALTWAARRDAIAWTLLPGLLFVPAFLSHTTALMLAPFALVASLVFRSESGLPMPWRGGPRLAGLARSGLYALALWGPVVATRLALPWIFTALNGGVDPFHGHDPSTETIRHILDNVGIGPHTDGWPWCAPLLLAGHTLDHAGSMLAHVWDDFLVHSAVAGALAALGSLPMLYKLVRKGAPWFVMALLAFAPYAWLFSLWGFRPVEKGAYYLPLLPILLGIGLVGTLSCLRLQRRWPWLGLAALLLLVQGWLAWGVLEGYDTGRLRRDWAAAATRIVNRGETGRGIVLTGDGHLKHTLVFHHRRELLAALMLGDLIPPATPAGEGDRFGRAVEQQIRHYLEQGHRIFAGEQFWATARKQHPGFAKQLLAALPWQTVRSDPARGRVLSP